LPANKYITSSCTINHGVVVKNNLTVFNDKAADASGFLLAIYQHFKLNYPKFYKMDNLSKLGWLASEILLKDQFKPDIYQAEQTGIVLANANSSLDDDIKYYRSVKDIPSPSLFVYTLPNIMIGEICIRNNFKGEHALFIQDKFDAGFIVQQVNYLLDKNILDACICGWVDFLEQEYKAVLFLVEKKKTESSSLFSKDNMDNIFDNNPVI
jgi:hypothetical protein